jgi:hypothetical protein
VAAVVPWNFPNINGRSEVHTGPCRRLGVIHGLYWLTVNLAEQQSVAIVVDDVQIRETSSTVKCVPVRAGARLRNDRQSVGTTSREIRRAHAKR